MSEIDVKLTPFRQSILDTLKVDGTRWLSSHEIVARIYGDVHGRRYSGLVEAMNKALRYLLHVNLVGYFQHNSGRNSYTFWFDQDWNKQR